MRRFLNRQTLKWFALGTTAAVSTVALSDEGTRRSLQFWGVAGPAYAHYRFTQWRVKNWSDADADREWERLHELHAPRVRDATLRLKGFYLKSAQVMSVQDDFMPPQYLEVCKMMQDRVPTEFKPGQARQIIEQQLGRPLESIFSEFDDKPVGAASIGQVHRARLLDGRQVAVKVQYPGIERKFRADLSTLIFFCDLAMPHQAQAMREVQKLFDEEFDYVTEQRNMRIIHDNVERRFGDRVVIPEPIPELCTRTVLTMTYVPGVKLVDALKQRFEVYAVANNQTVDEFLEEQKKLAKHPQSLAEARRSAWLTNRLIFVTDLLRNALRAINNFGAFFIGAQRRPYEWTRPPVNLAEVLQLVSDVMAYEILEVGVFNGDPHPGNILLTDDDRIGLIDYGQCKHFTDAERREYAELIVALSEDDRDRIVKALVGMGARTKHMNPDVLYRLACFWNDRSDAELMGGKNLSDFLDEMEARDPSVKVTDRHLLASRASMLLRGMGSAFNINMRLAPMWRATAVQVLAETPTPQ
jgi:aarF domain-containing kinase